MLLLQSIYSLSMRRVLALLTVTPEFQHFAVPELKALLMGLGLPLSHLLDLNITKHHEVTQQSFPNFPFIPLNVPDFEKNRKFFETACLNSVMVHKFILLLSEGKDYQQLFAAQNQELLTAFSRAEDQQLMVEFYSRNRVVPREIQTVNIHSTLAALKVCGKINFAAPHRRYILVQNHSEAVVHQSHSYTDTLKRVYFGIELCCNKSGRLKSISKYDLSKRIYLGPTSTDNDLAFLMCQQGLVSAGSIVFDPFVGTSSLLVPPQSRGAITLGCDLDMRVLCGYSVGRINRNSPFYDKDKKLESYTPKVHLNYDQYGLPYPQFFRMDCARPTFHKRPFIDVIITDPPYGIRAMSRKITKHQSVPKDEGQGIGATGDKEQIQQTQPNTAITNQQEQSQPETSQVHKNEVLQAPPPQQNLQATPPQQNLQAPPSQQNLQAIPPEQSPPIVHTLGDPISRPKKKPHRAGNSQKPILTQQQVQFRKQTHKKLSKQRTQLWQKFDRDHVAKVERQEIFLALLHFSNSYLVQKGRLVFLYPLYDGEEWKGQQSLPNHDGYIVIDMSENRLSRKTSRVLITLEKIKDII